jgi:dimethylhistidine N-methyltransferase
VSEPDTLGEAVRQGFTADPKRVNSRWLYDDRGSQLFEEITELPEYYLTDCEREIFREHADDVVDRCPPGTELVELGAGSAEKTRHLLSALKRRQGSTTYGPIDISREALDMAVQRFADDDAIEVHPIEASFTEGLAKLGHDPATPRLIAFIGSSIGNMTPEAQRSLLREVRRHLGEEDRFLLGTDLRKDEAPMLSAYDDSQGVTAAFTLNLLRRVNRELGGRFDEGAFEHVVRFDEEKSAIESYLESQRDQTVAIDAIDLTVTFDEGERIHVEDAYKYTDEMLAALFADTGLERRASWTDEDGWFAVHLLAADER